jgi:predicted GIY-YIG superfamily endonuclease
VLYPSYLSCPVNDREGQRDNLGTWEVPSVLACVQYVVVGAVSVVESPGSFRDCAGSIPAACMAQHTHTHTHTLVQKQTNTTALCGCTWNLIARRALPHTHTHNLRCWLSKNPRQLVIRQDKHSMSDANRRLSAVQGAEKRMPRPQAKASKSNTACGVSDAARGLQQRTSRWQRQSCLHVVG